MNLTEMLESALAGTSVTRDQALDILRAEDEDVITLVAAAGKVRRQFFGRKIKLNYLVNLKSGMCPENCHYCSQSLGSEAEILRYTWLSEEEALQAVEAGVSHGASTVCLVASGRGPSHREIDKVADIVSSIHEKFPSTNICTCLGFIDKDKAEKLCSAGSSRYNHNLNTAQSNYGEICSTHSYDDRVETVAAAKGGGLSPCSGLIAGMGETDEQLVEVAFGLRELGVDSIPVNFLLPFEGTPLASHQELTPQRCLKILAMVRFVNPDIEVRAAAGREYHLRSLQPYALEICNSIFLGDYLTSEGQSGVDDLAMIKDCGFEIEGEVSAPEICAGDNAEVAKVLDAAGIPIRHRGTGTEVQPNV